MGTVPDGLNKVGMNPPGMMLTVSAPTVGHRFIWNPENKMLYAVKNGEQVALEIASKVYTEEQALAFVTAFTVGYRHRDREIGRNPNVRHHQMLAETGAVGAQLGK